MKTLLGSIAATVLVVGAGLLQPPLNPAWTGGLSHVDKAAIDPYCPDQYCKTNHRWVITGPAQRVICGDSHCQVRSLPLGTEVHLVWYSDRWASSVGRVYIEDGGKVTISTDSVDANNLTCWCSNG